MRQTNRFSSLLGLISRTRRNHALEHASIHVLTSQRPRTPIIGRSDSRGFYLYTNLPMKDVKAGVQQALERLRAGERQLAVHPNCGTNLLAAGILSAIGVYLSLLGLENQSAKNRIQRFPMAILGATLGLLLARPLGARLQQYITTNSEPDQLEIVAVDALQAGIRNLYRIQTNS
jgi:hypothetical protein